jgi:hypothetical protein
VCRKKQNCIDPEDYKAWQLNSGKLHSQAALY